MGLVIASIAMSILTFAGGAFAGLAIGQGRARGENTGIPACRCDCSHSLALHDRDSGRCHGQVQFDKHDSLGEWIGHYYARCGCRQYVGPDPISSVWVPPLASSTGED